MLNRQREPEENAGRSGREFVAGSRSNRSWL